MKYQTNIIENTELPDGSYGGFRNGTDIEVYHQKKKYSLKSNTNVSIFGVQCLVIVNNGKAISYSIYA